MNRSLGTILRAALALVAAMFWFAALPAAGMAAPAAAPTVEAPCPDHADSQPAQAPAKTGCCIGAACALHCLPVNALPAATDAPRLGPRPLPIPAALALTGLPGAVPPPLYRPPRALA
ncbi:hypothetical protein DKG74_10300 [Zavarzinia aquatilis]|uniref:DUF2946 domain-containing protein n=2 Tax=Zavarzinia aquatilis TaxID=2211142 RepID=A0A317E9I6_9PROT|nr:hypothetical protein DKG74_10300 [Zavarzinia aquatilis]